MKVLLKKSSECLSGTLKVPALIDKFVEQVFNSICRSTDLFHCVPVPYGDCVVFKGIVVDGKAKVPIADMEAFKKARKKFVDDIKNEYGDAEWAANGGTPTVIEFGIDEQDSPIKNWSGVTEDMGDYSVYKYDNIKKYIVKSETCWGCPIACWDRSMLEKGKYAIKEPSHIPEYETAAMFVASGQGLIAVSIPSQKADAAPINISLIILLPRDRPELRHGCISQNPACHPCPVNPRRDQGFSTPCAGRQRAAPLPQTAK